MKKSSLAEQMRQRMEVGKSRNKHAQEEYNKQRAMHFTEIDKKAAKNALALIDDCVLKIKKTADAGKSELYFDVVKFTDATKDQEYYGTALSLHLSNFLRKKGLNVNPDFYKSEGDVDDPRNFYYYRVKISW